MTYEEIRCRLAEAYGWTFDAIDDMSPEQVESAIRGGRPPKGIAVTSAAEVAAVARDWRRYYRV